MPGSKSCSCDEKPRTYGLNPCASPNPRPAPRNQRRKPAQAPNPGRSKPPSHLRSPTEPQEYVVQASVPMRRRPAGSRRDRRLGHEERPIRAVTRCLDDDLCTSARLMPLAGARLVESRIAHRKETIVLPRSRRLARTQPPLGSPPRRSGAARPHQTRAADRVLVAHYCWDPGEPASRHLAGQLRQRRRGARDESRHTADFVPEREPDGPKFWRSRLLNPAIATAGPSWLRPPMNPASGSSTRPAATNPPRPA